MTSSRFFASVVIHESREDGENGQRLPGLRRVDVLVRLTHAESRFPESTNKVLAWKSHGAEVMRKMLWDNATKCFGEP